MDLTEHKHLVTCDWLAENLEDEKLVVVEATSLLPNYFDESASTEIIKVSGREGWEENHIPGSVFVDLLEDLSDTRDDHLMYGIASIEKCEDVLSNLGIGNNSAVVVYDRSMNTWAARFWWILRYLGLENAAVLNGGWTQWVQSGRPISADKVTPKTTHFQAHVQSELIVCKQDVLSALEDDSTVLVNALTREEFRGEPPHRYSRPGRIPGSINIPLDTLTDLESQHYVAEKDAQLIVEESKIESASAVICYCGGGIAACNAALMLTRQGVKNISVYDGSLTEWSADLSLPMETG